MSLMHTPHHTQAPHTNISRWPHSLSLLVDSENEEREFKRNEEENKDTL